jgi:pimeloyl-ACP methyl ester carboxylesterase
MAVSTSPESIQRGNDVTFVLIPGAGGESSYWHLVAAELRRRGHEALAVDIPADDDSADIPEYAQAVVEAIGDRRDVTLVAQSMGGFAVPLVCQRSSVRMVVLVNAMIPAPGERPGDWWANTGQAGARREMDLRDGRDPDADFDPFVTFLHDVPEDVVQSLPAPKPQSNTPFASTWTPPPWPDVPTHALVGRDDRFFPATFQRRVAQERLQITPDEIPGGHLAALSQPTLVADRLEAYATEARPARAME